MIFISKSRLNGFFSKLGVDSDEKWENVIFLPIDQEYYIRVETVDASLEVKLIFESKLCIFIFIKIFIFNV